MKTQRIIAIGCLLAISAWTNAQSWFMDLPLGNNVVNPAAYLGCRAGSTESLKLKTIEDLNIEMYTSDIERFRLLPDNTYTVGGSTVVADGFSLHSPDVVAFYTGGAPGPYSLEHLAAATNSSFQDAYRNGAATGTTVTGGGSMGFLGLKADDIDHTDLVVQLAKREGTVAPDRIRFLFTSELNGSGSTGADSQEGLEGLRLFAVDNDNVNVGVGDWYAANISDPSITEPEERLDIVDGKVRVRQLPSDPVSTSDEVVVVDMVTGLLEHRPISSLPDNCEWQFQNAPSNLNVVTAFGAGGAGCPGSTHRVGIGTNAPDFKLHVVSDESYSRGIQSDKSGSNTNQGVRGEARNTSTVTANSNHGLFGRAYNASGATTGVYGAGFLDGAELGSSTSSASVSGGHFVSDVLSGMSGTNVYASQNRTRILDGGAATDNYGTYSSALVDASSTTDRNHGVRAIAEARNSGTPVIANYGVRARAFGSSATTHYGVHATAGGTSAWAGWFQGNIWITGAGFVNNGDVITSDANLKTGVEDIENALELIMQLQPKTYVYDSAAHPHMGLSNDDQIGLLAQEVEAIVPEAVRSTTFPAQYDEDGNMLSEAMPVKGVVYTTLIPLLIGAVQEQQDQLVAQGNQLTEQQSANAALADLISEQSARLDQLEAALAACCTAGSGDDQRSGVIDNELLDPSTERLLTIAPNPFTEQTTVSYTLERGGRAMLMVHGSDGKHLQILEEGARSEGKYQYVWHTAHLAPGVYYVTLLLDGEPLVKRAVKVR